MAYNPDEIVRVAVKQLETGVQYKQPRMDEIRKNEDAYFMKKQPALRGRFNVPLPTVKGYVDTLLSKIDDAPKIKFEKLREQDLVRAKKATACWDFDSSSTQGKWAQKDRQAKKLAILSGRAILKFYAESDPEYKAVLDVVDYYDFVCEPNGGSNLDDHLFKYQINIFRTKEYLKTHPGYDQVQVAKLAKAVTEQDYKKNTEIYKNKINRSQSLGLDNETNNYVGQTLFNLTEGAMQYDGAWYYIVFDYQSGIWLRCEPLEKIFGVAEHHPGKSQFVSWAIDDEAFEFWSLGTVDMIRPVSEAIRILFNQTLDNVQKRNWDMTAFDSNVFPDPSQLEYRPDGLVVANLKQGQNIQQHIYRLETPDTTAITVNMMEFVKNFLGQDTGITPGAQGKGDEDKVGIYYGNLQQVADRIGLINKSYREAWEELGLLYDWGLYEHIPEKRVLQIMGNNGVEEVEVNKKDIEPDFAVKVIGGSSDEEKNAILAKKRELALDRIISNPLLAPRVNPEWLLEEVMRNAEYTEEDIRRARDIKNYANQELQAEAAEAIAEIIDGKMPPLNRQANPGFIQKIVDYATDHTFGNINTPEGKKKDLDTYSLLMGYAMQHMDISLQNTIRAAEQQVSQMGMPIAPTPGQSMMREPVATSQRTPGIPQQYDLGFK